MFKVLSARLKADYDSRVQLAWLTEFMARQKTLKPLDQYQNKNKQIKLLKKGEKMDASPWLKMMGVEPKAN